MNRQDVPLLKLKLFEKKSFFDDINISRVIQLLFYHDVISQNHFKNERINYFEKCVGIHSISKGIYSKMTFNNELFNFIFKNIWTISYKMNYFIYYSLNKRNLYFYKS